MKPRRRPEAKERAQSPKYGIRRLLESITVILVAVTGNIICICNLVIVLIKGIIVTSLFSY